MPRISLPLLWLALGASVGCGDTALPPATIENTVDTLDLWALNGTEVGTPSALDLLSGLPVRPELGDAFDIGFDIEPDGTAVLIPARQLGGSETPGIQVMTTSFDLVTRAPLEDYVTDSSTTIQVGTVLTARSRSSSLTCPVQVGSLPRYAKLEILEVDDANRTVTLKIMANLNCGYRDLEEGLPVN